MQYRKNKKGQDISLLGFGCMRFTTKAGHIDIDKAEKEILAAVEAGVNYFDTAYIYSGSEAALGEIIERNGLRQKINIATIILMLVILLSRTLSGVHWITDIIGGIIISLCLVSCYYTMILFDEKNTNQKR